MLEHPTAKLLFDRVKAVADSRLRDLTYKSFGITKEHFLETAAAGKLDLKVSRSHSDRNALALDNRPPKRRPPAHKYRYSQNTVIADKADLCHSAVFRDANDRDYCGYGEVNVLKPVAGLIQHLAEF
jgi:hypothetical protein